MVISIQTILDNPLLITHICEHLDPKDVVHVSSVFKDPFFQSTMNTIIANLYESHMDTRIDIFKYVVHSQMLRILTFISHNREIHAVRLLNEIFEYVYDQKALLNDSRLTTTATLIEEKLLAFVDYYDFNAQHYLSEIFS